MPSISIAAKALAQLGPLPLALNLLYRLSLRTGRYKRTVNVAVEDKLMRAGVKRLFDLPDRAVLEKILAGEKKTRLLEEAGEIIQGKIRLFGGEPYPLQLGFEGQLQHWTEYELHPGLILSPHAPVTDIKFLWEPVRFGWAYTLGRAYHLQQDDQYASAFWGYFEEFSRRNPAYCGPHWMNGQEAALRLMALVWAFHVLGEAPSSTEQRRAALLRSVTQHAARIPPTLLYARSQNNNHLLTEAAGLYTAGLLFSHAGWRDLGWKWLNWCFQNQVGEYGEYIQHSTNYHRLMLNTACWVNYIKDDRWPHASLQGLARASHFLFSMLDGISGRVPNLGANDGAHILPLSSQPYDDFRPAVQPAARAFLNTQLPSGPWDETALWLGLEPVEKTFEPGHYLGDNLHGSSSWAYLRASRFKSRLGHMDQLHLDLWWRGLNVARDAGSYLYNAAPPWDNPLVSTRVHNTVMVDDRDQMKRGGRFLTLDWFPAWSQASFESDGQILQRVLAHHTGYKGVRHDRRVTVYTDDRWVVDDKLASRAFHSYRLHWLLADWELSQLEYAAEHSTVKFALKSPYGLVRVEIQASAPGEYLSLSIVRAGKLVYGMRQVQPCEGWVSPTYGVKIPALSIALDAGRLKAVSFSTQFIFPG